VEAASRLFPVYCAVSRWEPSARLDAEKLAVPLALSELVPNGIAPSKKLTLPVGVPALPATCAVSATVWPVTAVLGVANRVVEVLASVTVTDALEAEVVPLALDAVQPTETPPAVNPVVLSVATLPELVIVPAVVVKL